MSLNWMEIDKILEETGLEASFLQRIRQPSFDVLALDFYKPGNEKTLLVSLTPQNVSFHITTGPVPKPPKNQRFAQLLKARIMGAKVVSIVQIKKQRIVEMTLSKDEEILHLCFKLWANAANVILTDSGRLIIDAQYRRPGRNEVKDRVFPPLDLEEKLPEKIFRIRDFSPFPSLTALLDAEFGKTGIEGDRVHRLETARKIRDEQAVRTENQIEVRLNRLDALPDPEQDRLYGNMLLSIGKIVTNDGVFSAWDFSPPYSEVRIPVLKSAVSIEAASEYYERARKNEREKEQIASELEKLGRRKEKLQTVAKDLEQFNEEAVKWCFKLAAKTSRKSIKPEGPGLKLKIDDFTVLAGKNSRDNDELLRRHVKGQDTWLHVRDWSGGYVFIKARKDKTVPLDVLLKAAQLAVHFSKARGGKKVDLYYTKVKYLRRAKNAALGTVLPTQEKNLTVDSNPSLVHELLGNDDL